MAAIIKKGNHELIRSLPGLYFHPERLENHVLCLGKERFDDDGQLF